jgi:hypothetical protein
VRFKGSNAIDERASFPVQFNSRPLRQRDGAARAAGYLRDWITAGLLTNAAID